jgi:hypothetical protein
MSQNTVNGTYSNAANQRDAAYILGEVIGYYLMPGASLIAFFLNFTICYILKNKNFKNRFYSLLFCRSFLIMILSAFTVGFQNAACTYCQENIYNTYPSLFYKLYILRFCSVIIILAEGFFEIVLNLDRYLTLTNKKMWPNKIYIKVYFVVFIIIGIVAIIPDYMALQITYSNELNLYFFSYNGFGKSIIYNLYYIIIIFAVYIIQLASLAVINVKLIKEYKRFLSKKAALKLKISKKERETKFTKIIIITSSIYLIFRMINFLSVLLFRLATLKGLKYYAPTNLILNFSYLFMGLIYIVNVLIYISIDQNIKDFLFK